MLSTEARAERVGLAGLSLNSVSYPGWLYVGCADKAPVTVLGTAFSIMSDLA